MIWNGRFPSSVGVGGVPKISSEAAVTLPDADADDDDDAVAAAAADEYLVTRDNGGDDDDDNDFSHRDFVVTKVDGDDNDLVDDTTDDDIDLFWFRATNAVTTWFVLRSVVENITMKVIMNFVVDGVMVIELASLFWSTVTSTVSGFWSVQFRFVSRRISRSDSVQDSVNSDNNNNNSFFSLLVLGFGLGRS